MSQLGSAAARYGTQQAQQNFSMADLDRSAAAHMHDDDGEEGEDDDVLEDYGQVVGSGRMPMNSTLMASDKPARYASTAKGRRDRRPGIPEHLMSGKRTAVTAPVAFRDRDVTLTTQTESVVDDDEEDEEEMVHNVREGTHGRHVQNNAISNRHLDLHRPLPSTAAKQRGYAHHDSDESESVAESSTHSAVSHLDAACLQTYHPFKRNNSRAGGGGSFNESTGNHQGFMHSPRRADVGSARNVSDPVRNNVCRPKLPADWEDGFDNLVSTRKTATRSYAPATDGAESGSNNSGYAAGMQHQKYHDEFVKRDVAAAATRKLNSGTEASTSGETLVDGNGGGGLRLPSGQRMGKGIPSNGISFPHDVSGVSMALESPEKAKLGVEHRAMVPERIQAFAAPAIQHRTHKFDEINAYIHQMGKRVDRVEDESQNVRKDMKALRNDFAGMRGTKHQSPFKASTNKQPYAQTGARQAKTQTAYGDSGTEDARQYRQRLAGAQRIAGEIGESMEYYRNTLAELRKEELLLIEREKNRDQERAQSLTYVRRVTDDAEQHEDDVDALRAQVDAVATQVERLRVMVHHKEAARHVYPASSPIKPSYRRSIGVGNDKPFIQHRKVSGESAKSAKSGSSNVRVTSNASRSPFVQQQDEEMVHHLANDGGHDDDDDIHGIDVSHIAEARAEQAEERIAGNRGGAPLSQEHDEEHCLQCIRRGEKERRKAARKQASSAFALGTQAKPRNHSSASSAEDIQAHARALLEQALEELGGGGGGGSNGDSHITPGLLRLAQRQRSLLERTIGEEMDEFYHEKCTYLELAEEFKSFSPDLNGPKRRILSEHIMIAVEHLEMRADRIERLRAALAATLPTDTFVRSGKRMNEHVPPSSASTTKASVARSRHTPPSVDVHRGDDDNVDDVVYDRLFAN